MSFLEIAIIAVGLSMDAFAVSVTLGLSVKKLTLIQFLIPGIFFGFFQALMPLIGYFGGTYFAYKIQFLDHWIAFILLGFIGGKMIKDSFSQDDEKPKNYSFGFGAMLVMAVATSIDALAVGITFSFFALNIFIVIMITGLTTFIISTAGVKIGNFFGERFNFKMELIGGAFLILLGIKILIEHLFFNSTPA
ncbi:MAG: manganese efflux pump MntP family protein [Treponema sp.]|nr:manganese efflux pump MntP family protein [Treponema sp.]